MKVCLRQAGRRGVSSASWLCAMLIALSFAPSALGTWSIVIVDTDTQEVAAGSATCLLNFDLHHELPLVLVDVGAACAQSRVDNNAVNRRRIREQILLGTPPDEIIEYLAGVDGSHESRQYGIVDMQGRAATFTGSEAGPHASGVTGRIGSMVYAIQGNVLTGAPVVLAAQQAVLATPGGLPEKLMAGMEAAYSMGGDGRCSCNWLAPEWCGAPPDSFEKSAHIGFMIVTRGGDADGTCNADDGCANGDYYMDFNVPYQLATDLDPVLQLREQFDSWRAGLIGQPDAVESLVTIDPPFIRIRGQNTTTMTIALRDWRGDFVADGVDDLAVTFAAGSDVITLPGFIEYIGAGIYELDITGFGVTGLQTYDIIVTHAGRPVVLLPRPTLRVAEMEDFDGDGDVDPIDHQRLASCLGGPDQDVDPACAWPDVDRDSDVDLEDVARFQRNYTNYACLRLDIVEQPLREDLCVGDRLALSVAFEADPLPSFQWRKDGVPIPGEVTPFYAVSAVDEVDEGFYSVDLISTCGIIASDVVPVRVTPSGVGPCP